MKKLCLSGIIIFVSFLMSGCWDQDLLRNARLVYGEGFDLEENGKLLSTFVIRDAPDSEQSGPKNDIINTVSNTPEESRNKADEEISRLLTTYRNRIVLIGEEMAKQDIYQLLDFFYRDPKSALNAKIAVVKGKAADLLSLKKVGNVLIEEEIDELIKSKEETTTVPKVTIESIFPIMKDPGEDFVVPYLIKSGNRVDVSRAAMFHNHEFTGTLSTNESTMFSLLKGKMGKTAIITQKTNKQQGNKGVYNYLTFNIEKSKPKMKVLIQKNDQIKVRLELKLKVSVLEYPKDYLNEKKVVNRLNKTLTKEITNLVNKTLKKMQKARCDGLGVGRQLIAFHPDVWKKQKKDWEHNYQKVHFVPKVQVEITKKGIIN